MFGKIPFPILILLTVSVFAYVLLHLTKYGRYVYAVGGNIKAATASGVNVFWTRVGTFVVSGVTAGIAAILMTARINAAQPNIGVGYEIDAIAACVIGGTSEGDSDGIRVAYIAKNTVDAFHATLNNAAKESLDALVEDGTISSWLLYDGQTDPITQVNLLGNALTSGANFVIFLPAEAEGSAPVVSRCAEEGIPIFSLKSSENISILCFTNSLQGFSV